MKFIYSDALLNATYKNGRPGTLTEEHKKAEYHQFKTQYLFKEKKIPKDFYVSRLIQHFLVIKAIETQLQSLSTTEKSEINAFFTLSYLEHLWRTPAIQKDLEQLGVNTNEIPDDKIATETKNYLKDIEKLNPKALLTHFLFHVAGFMHGGNIIQTKYIKPSNLLTDYQIPTNQYDFSQAVSSIDKHSSVDVYNDMISQLDKIELNSDEYQSILEQGKSVYETMTSIYDDLCDMHMKQPKQSCNSLAVMCVSMIAMAIILKLLANFYNLTTNSTAPRGPR